MIQRDTERKRERESGKRIIDRLRLIQRDIERKREREWTDIVLVLREKEKESMCEREREREMERERESGRTHSSVWITLLLS